MLRVRRRRQRADAGADGLACADSLTGTDDHSDTIVSANDSAADAGADALCAADDDVGVSLVGSLHGIGRVRLVAELPVRLRQREPCTITPRPTDSSASAFDTEYSTTRDGRRHGLLGRVGPGLRGQLVDEHLGRRTDATTRGGELPHVSDRRRAEISLPIRPAGVRFPLVGPLHGIGAVHRHLSSRPTMAATSHARLLRGQTDSSASRVRLVTHSLRLLTATGRTTRALRDGRTGCGRTSTSIVVRRGSWTASGWRVCLVLSRPTPSPTASPAPTATTIVSTFDKLQGAIADHALIDIVTSDTITFAETVVIEGIAVTISSTSNATLSGGDAVRLFTVRNGADLALVGLTLTGGYCEGVPRVCLSLAPSMEVPLSLILVWAMCAQDVDGGAMYVTCDSSATITDSTFAHNLAYYVSSNRARAPDRRRLTSPRFLPLALALRRAMKLISTLSRPSSIRRSLTTRHSG